MAYVAGGNSCRAARPPVGSGLCVFNGCKPLACTHLVRLHSAVMGLFCRNHGAHRAFLVPHPPALISIDVNHQYFPKEKMTARFVITGTSVLIVTFVTGYSFGLSKGTSNEATQFPFYDDHQQYAWYDAQDVPMSDRCYTTMNPPCTEAEWRQALGFSLSPEEESENSTAWCSRNATEWNLTMDACIASRI